MKIKIEVDCTPDEARTFFGLPNLDPVHDVMTDAMKEQAEKAASMMDPETLMKAWMPGGAGFEHMRDAFMSALNSGPMGSRKGD